MPLVEPVLDAFHWAVLATPPASTPTPAAVGAGATGISSVWDMVLKGGWIMVPIAICSIVAITIIVERLITTRRSSVVPPPFLASLTAVRDDPRRALDLCSANTSPVAAVIAAAVKSRNEHPDRRDQLIREAGHRQVSRLRQRTRLLSAMPQTATMLGLLGTVIGMIRTFTVIAASGDSLGKTERLAHGIYEAWTATAAGLVVAVPVLIMYHIVMSRIDNAAAALDTAATDWLEAEGQPVVAAAPTATAAAPSDRAVAHSPAPESANGVAVAAA